MSTKVVLSEKRSYVYLLEALWNHVKDRPDVILAMEEAFGGPMEIGNSYDFVDGSFWIESDHLEPTAHVLGHEGIAFVFHDDAWRDARNLSDARKHSSKEG